MLQWAGPRDRVGHDQRWAQARRLLHDETLPTEVRIAGLLVVLYAQPATNIRTLRFDQVHPTPDGARITFGTTPIDLVLKTKAGEVAVDLSTALTLHAVDSCP